jgi:hypothetical protein
MDARGGRAASCIVGIKNGKGIDRPEAEANRYGHKHSFEDSEGDGKMMRNRRLPLGVGIGLFGALAIPRYVAVVLG